MKAVPIILGAAASLRMGRSKLLCDFDGRPSIEVLLSTCRDAGTESPVVVLGADADVVRAGANLEGAAVVTVTGEGAESESVKRGLREVAADAEGFFLVPGNHPLVEPDDFQSLVSAWVRMRERGKMIFVPQYGLQRGCPVLVSAELRGDFESLPDGRPFRGLVQVHSARVHHVDVDHPGVVMPMDTPEEYLRCLDLHKTRKRERRRNGPP